MNVDAILKHANRKQIVRTRRLFWTPADAERFYVEHEGRFYYDRLIAGMTWWVFSGQIWSIRLTMLMRFLAIACAVARL